MRAYMFRRLAMILALAALIGGWWWTTGGISERDLAAIAGEPQSALQFPVRALAIQTADGRRINLKVEVAATPEHWQQGLMHRTDLADDAGMYFDMGPQPRVVSFWMKNTLIPLDMIFIAADGTIAHIHPGAQPGDLRGVSSVEPVTAVLEIGGGRGAALGIKIGDRVVFPAEK